jgi:putative toxin-antitoxin system antitoxin component (TIGR02293 family)
MITDLRQLLNISGKVSSRLQFGVRIEQGLSSHTIDRVKSVLGIPDLQLSAALGISAKTMSRLRQGKRRLPLPVGDRLYRLAHIFALAQDVLEDPARAREWIRTPQIGLNNRIPFEVMVTEAGAREVEDVLTRIEYGVLA